jgi:hypothetical protein
MSHSAGTDTRSAAFPANRLPRELVCARISTDYGLGSRHIPHSEGPSGKAMLL